MLKRAWNTAKGAEIVRQGGTITFGGTGGFTHSEVVQILKAVGFDTQTGIDLSSASDDDLKQYIQEAIKQGLLTTVMFNGLLNSQWTSSGGRTKDFSAVAFESGGYTGEWGSNGKLAILHEKELILNTQDTQNLLQTMQVMDQMLRNIELQAAAAAFDHALSANLPKSGGGDTLQQEVTIHAEFPNATNHSEIEQAFDTLINRASQFANRNR